MANVQLAVAGDDTTQVILSVPGVQGPTGSSIPPSGTTNQILFKQSNTDYDTGWSFVTNAMVDSSAAIAGTKISPNFGSQNVVTTGTSTAASFIPTSSSVPTNGVYLPSANNVAISTNGTGRLFVDSSGRTGINTAPDGTASFAVRALTDATNGGMVILSADGAGAVISRLNDGGLTFRNGGSERLRITSDGKLGLGTSTAYAKLQVNGDIRCSFVGDGSDFIGWGSGGGTAKYAYISATNEGSQDVGLSFNVTTNAGSSNIEAIRIDDLGNVGIGTTTVRTRFHTNLATDKNVGFDLDGSNEARILAFNDAYTATKPLCINGEDLRFQISGGEEARLDSSGRFLVGTSSAFNSGSNALLQLSTSGATGSSIRRTTTSSDASLGYLNFWSSAGECASISASTDGTQTASTASPGRLVFSTTKDGASSPTSKLTINNAGLFKVHQQSSQATNTYSSEGGYVKHYETNDIGTAQRTLDIASLGDGTYGSNIRFLTNANSSATATERMRIDSSGAVLIGGTLPSSPNATFKADGSLLVGTTAAPNSETFAVSGTAAIEGLNGSINVFVEQDAAATVTYTLRSRESGMMIVTYSPSSTTTPWGSGAGDGLYLSAYFGNLANTRANVITHDAGRASTARDGAISITDSGGTIIVSKTAGTATNGGDLSIAIISAHQIRQPVVT